MSKILLLLLSVSICGCSAIVSLQHNGLSIVHNPNEQWIHIHTKEKLSGDLYIRCYEQAREEVIEKHQLPKDANLYDFRYEESVYHGKCLREKGFIFSPKIFSNYCCHVNNKIDCKAFSQYKK